ncbi:hypothetical protein pdam_00025053, partial [Pocillopora damicornis]
MFTLDDLGQNSTFHGLKAIYYMLLSFAGQLTHQRFSSARGISLESQWIPRSLNEKADHLSRFCDKDESICFPASESLPRFNSKFASPGSSGVNALVQDWSDENNYLIWPVFWPDFVVFVARFGSRSSFRDQSLRRLVPGLLRLQLGSKAPSTVSMYKSGWLKWRKWASSKNGKPVNLQAFYGRDGILPHWSCPTGRPLVKSSVEAAKRKLARPVQPKEPLFADRVQAIADA